MTDAESVTREYIWISRWHEFQHYAPERDRAPAWIKAYTKQLDDEDYRDLTIEQRGLLHELRLAFSRSHGKLTTDTRKLGNRLGARVTTRQLAALNHAGFIEFLSRDDLDQRLESFYASRAPAPSPEEEVDVEVEVEKEKTLSSDVQGVYDHWRQARGKTRTNYDRISPGRRKKIQSRLQEFSAAELKHAIDNVAKDPWPDRPLHDDLTVIFRSRETVERFLEMNGTRTNGHAGTPYEQAKAWVLKDGWRFPDSDLLDQLGRFGLEAEQKKSLAAVAMNLQETQP